MPTKPPRSLPAASLALLGVLCTGCASWYNDQIEVPGTNQRIVVGSDNWPSKKGWVLVDGKFHTLNIVRQVKQ